MDIKNSSELLMSMYRNELTKTDLIPTYRRILLNDVLVISNILKYVRLIDDVDVEVFNEDGSSAFTFERQSLDKASASFSEYIFRRNGLEEVIAQDLTQKLAGDIDTAIFNFLAKKATAVSTTKTDIVEKIVELKDNKFDNKDFVIGLGLKEYLTIMEKFHGQFPYQVIYIPHIEDGKIYAFKRNCVYVNLVLGELAMKKNVLTGAYNFVLDVLDFKLGCKDVFKI